MSKHTHTPNILENKKNLLNFFTLKFSGTSLIDVCFNAVITQVISTLKSVVNTVTI